ncbi:prostaglandin E synthase 2 [Octopus sinensis]|uniref:Prostaglandin E synthase 2 n=2 Tax=Octopus TaxID=6643 RepID=A0A6C0PNG0_OCTVU|nr:prostaglandin E synthase 2 [Octopus sinensis]QHX41556.1 prostaglandin-E synthase 2 [Octopus vulgaris]
MAVRLGSQSLWNNFRKIDNNYLHKNYFLFRKIDTVQKVNHAKYWKGHNSNYFSKKIFNRVSCVAGVTTLICASYYRYVYGDTFNNIPNVLAAKEKGFPQFKISRSIKSKHHPLGVKLTLFQYQTCPFCCKVRAMLDYRGYSYDVVEVNSIWRTQIKWSKYKKVPILVCEGIGEDDYLQINDSSVVMSLFESHLWDNSQSIEKLLTYFPAIESKDTRGKTVYDFPNKYFIMFQEGTPYANDKFLKKERKWRKWVDDRLVHTLSPNVYRTPSEALQAFKYFENVGDWGNNFSKFECFFIVHIGAAAMYFVAKMLKKKHKLHDDVRFSLYEACREWNNALQKEPFMGGNSPNLADLSAYGVLSSIEGCTAFQDLLEHTKIGKWYYRTKEAVINHKGIGLQDQFRE